MSRKILLDTHIALWLLTDDPRISTKIKSLTHDISICWIFHQVSLWEIQIKYSLGKLELPSRPQQCMPKFITESGFDYHTISDEGIFMLEKLPAIHRDPFDRMLLAHAVAFGWEFCTADKLLHEYPVRMLS